MKRILFSILLFFYAALGGYGQAGKFIDYSVITDIQASSALSDYQDRYTASNVMDGTDFSWSEGAPGNGIGEYITITFEDITVAAGFVLKNGYGQLEYYGKNNRVKSFKILFDDNYSETVEIRDSINFEQYLFKSPVRCSKIRLIINDIYPGTQYDDACIAEIRFLSQPFDDAAGLNRMAWRTYETVLSEPPVVAVEYMEIDDYLPFDTGNGTKIALLDEESALQLTDNLPRLDGATALYPLYSSFVHAVYPYIEMKDNFLEWAYFPHDALPEIVSWGGNSPSIVQCTKTASAYQRLIDGKADIIFCYEPSQDQIQKAAKKGIRFNLTPIGKDAFVFFVNIKSAVTNLTQNQIRDIYCGNIINWKSITGIDEPVIAYQRPENSGSQTALQSIMGAGRIIAPLRTFYVPEMGRTVDEVSLYHNYNSAIGYSFLYYTTVMHRNSSIKTIAIDGISPSKETIRSNRYPFVKNFYAVTTGNESANTRRFIDWILSAQGQKLVEKTGYIPVSRFPQDVQ
ncbi:MAG: substrate-binding domain-containing protein [Treponema sp.]|jgi:phosphate transport system substrate-binding protein|nr:substrate-binding domain-containing protein [Treponema sp.]